MFYPTDYNLFHEFIRNYYKSGFMGINDNDHFMVRFNKVLEKGGQFFYVADLLKLMSLYVSPSVQDFFGFEVEDYDLSTNLTYTHPSDIERRSRIRARVIENGQKLFINKGGDLIISSNFRMKNYKGEYLQTISQAYMFFLSVPFETVYILNVSTKVEWLTEIIKKGHYHYYEGRNLNIFKYPDEELSNISTNVSERELEILRYIHLGMSSKEIADKLFLSPHTISTHRRNILNKSGKSSLGEVIYELEGIGMI